MQARSIASTERMLDAAERLLSDHGPDAMTVEAVVAEAGTSIGSFYTRFGDRAGLLVAMQDRFLGRLEASMTEAFAGALDGTPLDQAIAHLCEAFFKAFSEHRNAFVAYMIQSRADPVMRARGAQASLAAARLVRAIIDRHKAEVRAHADTAADTVYRTLFALATQEVMFDPNEVSEIEMSLEQRAAHVASMLVCYLERT